MRAVARAVSQSTLEVVEDACAFSWAQFMQYQPERDRNWRAWLFRTAERQGWTLERQAREHAVADRGRYAKQRLGRGHPSA